MVDIEKLEILVSIFFIVAGVISGWYTADRIEHILRKKREKKIDIKPCSYCGGTPMIRPVGDRKEYWICMCSKCFITPVPTDCASVTQGDAVKMWNKYTTYKAR